MTEDLKLPFNVDMPQEERHEKLLSMCDKDIDFSDIPEIDKTFLQNAQLVQRQPKTELISIRIELTVLKEIKVLAQSQADGKYQTLINDILRTYVAHNEK